MKWCNKVIVPPFTNREGRRRAMKSKKSRCRLLAEHEGCCMTMIDVLLALRRGAKIEGWELPK